MTLYVLDSDAMIDLLNGISSSTTLFEDLVLQGGTLCTCDVVLAEVYSGLSEQDATTASELLDAFVFLASTSQISRVAGTWRYQYARQGVKISATDALVAATAVLSDAMLITGNLRHYPMPEVSIVPLPRVAR